MYKKYYLNSQLYNYKSDEYIKLLSRLEVKVFENILKTDLFEEAYGKDELLNWLCSKCNKFVGIDFSCEIIRKAKLIKNKYNNLYYLLADVRRLPFKNDIFDLVISPSTLDHFSEIDLAIKEIYRVMKPNGLLIIVLHNKFNLPFILALDFQYALGLFLQKNFYYSFKDIVKILETNGFLIKYKTTIVHIPFLFSTISNCLERLNSKCLRNINLFCINLIRKYSMYNTILHYLTGWFIAVIAQKYDK